MTPSFWNVIARRDARTLEAGERLLKRLTAKHRLDEMRVVRCGMSELERNLAQAREFIAEDVAPWFEVQQ